MCALHSAGVSTTSLDSLFRPGIVTQHADWRGPLLPVLHAVQAELGYVDPAVVPVIAHELNLSVAEVHGVVSFYRGLPQCPAGAGSGPCLPLRGVPGRGW